MNDYGQSSIWYNLVDYDVGDDHVCSISEKKAMCSGNSTNVPELLSVPPGLTDAIQLHAGWGTTRVLQSNGIVVCWGDFINQAGSSRLIFETLEV